jgi:hypothetical protein
VLPDDEPPEELPNGSTEPLSDVVPVPPPAVTTWTRLMLASPEVAVVPLDPHPGSMQGPMITEREATSERARRPFDEGADTTDPS